MKNLLRTLVQECLEMALVILAIFAPYIIAALIVAPIVLIGSHY